jgi:AcrR family transcriptional regulator
METVWFLGLETRWFANSGQARDSAADMRGSGAVQSVTRAHPGRPAVLAEDQRRSLLLDAAARVFLSHGYGASTVNAIAVEARMSKKTLYQVFPSKLALFDALLEDRIMRLPSAPEYSGDSLEEELSQLLIAIADNLLRPDRIGLIRLIITDGQASSELATAFDRLEIGNKMNVLQTWVTRKMACGELPGCDPFEVARLLFGMTIAEPAIRALCRAPEPEHAPSIEERIVHAVRVFLHGLAGGAKME